MSRKEKVKIKSFPNVKKKEIRWEKLDNTALLFPVISGENMSNVYRIAVELNELINPDLLSEALEMVLPKFIGFDLRMRRGFFWFYFEENGKPAPKVKKEAEYPCQYIKQNRNRHYMFRVTYYKNRINLEAFHAIADGAGALQFLKELTYQYLRLAHPKLRELKGDDLSGNTSLDREDSFIKYFQKEEVRPYPKKKACQLVGETFKTGKLGVIHGYFSVSQLAQVCVKYNASFNEYLVSAYMWSLYLKCKGEITEEHPLRIAIPVNLRPFFKSVTTKNFFVMISGEFIPESPEREYTFPEVLEIVRASLRAQINKEYLEKMLSYNVSNEMNIAARAVPLVLKNMAIKSVYTSAALANTSTVTNIGGQTVDEEYREYIKRFHALLPMSKGHNIKGAICWYEDTMTFTFTSILKDTDIQMNFFRQLTADGIDVEIESNGIYYG